MIETSTHHTFGIQPLDVYALACVKGVSHIWMKLPVLGHVFLQYLCCDTSRSLCLASLP